MIISVPVSELFRYPTVESEHVDDALYGTEVTVLDSLCGFKKIRTSYGYEGYVRETDISEKLASPNRIIVYPWADLKPAGSNFYAPIMALPMGSLVDAGFSEELGRHAMIVLPDKRMFYIRKEALGVIPHITDEDEARKVIVDSALSFIGTQYRWGGRTHNGVDCSGLAFTAYQMAGITVWRDADPDRTEGMKLYQPDQLKDCAKPGDMLFFPGHVALYLGKNKFVHASSGRGAVGINSLDPEDLDYNKWCNENLKCIGSMF